MLKRSRALSPPPPLPSSYDDEQPGDFDELAMSGGGTSSNQNKRRRTVGPNAWDSTSRRMRTKGISDLDSDLIEDDDEEEDEDDNEDEDNDTPKNVDSDTSSSAYTSVNTLLNELNSQRLSSMASRNRKDEPWTHYSDHDFVSTSSEPWHVRSERRQSSSSKRVQFAPSPTKEGGFSTRPKSPLRSVYSTRRPHGILINRNPLPATPATPATWNKGVTSLPTHLSPSQLSFGVSTFADPVTAPDVVDESEAVKSRYEDMNRLLGTLALSRRQRQPEIGSP